jgi:EAL domain-containing protein (putative c-di-GMP-specific phosphodiesterase class I)
VARLPGDRFAICIPSLKTFQPVVDLFDEQGLRLFNKPVAVEDRMLNVTTRTGCAMFPQDGADAETIVHDAEVALQNARLSGAPYHFYSKTQSDRLEERVDLEQRVRRAIERHEFHLYYQPKIELATKKIAGIEALLRWPRPHAGDFFEEPATFVPVLEQTGLIVDVGKWALDEAAGQYARWRASGLNAPRIAVNLSARQMQDATIVSQVRDATRRCGQICGIDLEITESMLIENVGSAASKLREMRSLGVEISLDDFGTGYSSLAVLQTLPISSIKIDRSFVTGMTEDVAKTSMISAIIALARSLGFKTIAEGVETEEQANLLRLLRCDQMQGYLFSHPVPPDAIAAMLAPI